MHDTRGYRRHLGVPLLASNTIVQWFWLLTDDPMRCVAELNLPLNRVLTEKGS